MVFEDPAEVIIDHHQTLSLYSSQVDKTKTIFSWSKQHKVYFVHWKIWRLQDEKCTNIWFWNWLMYSKIEHKRMAMTQKI